MSEAISLDALLGSVLEEEFESGTRVPEDPGFPSRISLPIGPGGIPVWQPPKVGCDDLIGEEFYKMRKAVLEFADGDVAKTTEILDWETQSTLNERYQNWAMQNCGESKRCGMAESQDFYHNLAKELEYDANVFYDEGYKRMGVIIGLPSRFHENYHVECHDPYAPLWGGDQRIVEKTAAYDAEMEQFTTKYHAEQKAAEIAEEAQRAAVRNRMRQYKNLQPSLKQNISSIPLILGMINSSKRKQASEGGSKAELHGDDVD